MSSDPNPLSPAPNQSAFATRAGLTVREGDYAPYNFLTMFSDGFIAVWLLVLLYLYHRWVGFQNPDQAWQRERQTR